MINVVKTTANLFSVYCTKRNDGWIDCFIRAGDTENVGGEDYNETIWIFIFSIKMLLKCVDINFVSPSLEVTGA